MEIIIGFKEEDCRVAAQLYAQAFKRKFENLIGDEENVSALLERGINPNYCLACYHEDELVGLAGFHISHHSLIKLNLFDFIQQFGLIKGLFKGILSRLVFYRKTAPKNELLMDGIAVHEDFRGQGIGSHLFDELFSWTKAQGYEAIHLDVIDENPKAKVLYERLGFKETSYEKVPYFIEKIIGVSGVTHMRKILK